MPKTELPPRVRVSRRALHGVLLLDKPLGMSSHQALQKAKWLLRAEKAGHTGTLDPLATGLLPLCFGAATKFSQVSLDADKRYVADIRLGVRTTTGDAEGEVMSTHPVSCSEAEIDAALASLVGDIEQVPPMHSALKKDGKPLYAYARQGVEVVREARRVRIHSLRRLPAAAGASERLQVDVWCSKGTYVRTLAEAIGEALGCGASLAGLRRTETGNLNLAHGITLEALEAMPEADRLSHLHPVDALVADWPAIALSQQDAARFLTGLRRRVAAPDAEAVRVYGPPLATEGTGRFLGTGRVVAGELIAERLLSPPEVASQWTQVTLSVVSPST